jgi:alpha-tubulin suppressor-like RCC1 family protein
VAGARFTAGLDPAGNVVIWGENPNNRLTPPPGIQGAVDKLFASGLTLCAVTKTGGVACLGPADDRYSPPPPPSDLAAVTSVAIGFTHGCASLAPEGRVSCWGDNTLNQTAVPEGLSGVTQVVANTGCTYALKGN